MKTTTLVSVGIGAIAMLAVIQVTAKGRDPAENAPRKIRINDIQKKLPAVPFDHFHHASRKGLHIPCTTCHHKAKGTNVQTTCSDCHGKHRNGKFLTLKGAFHKRCITCHNKANKKAGKTVAPHTCSGCHVKPKKK